MYSINFIFKKGLYIDSEINKMSKTDDTKTKTMFISKTITQSIASTLGRSAGVFGPAKTTKTARKPAPKIIKHVEPAVQKINKVKSAEAKNIEKKTELPEKKLLYIYSSDQFVKEKLFKIGIVNSAKPESVAARLRALNTSNPNGFFVKTWESHHALYIERCLHKFFQLRSEHNKKKNKFHMKEWMSIESPELAIYYVDSTINHFEGMFLID